jgi:LysR family hydrogen peroxide-inducible transcriptional activator
VNLRDLEYLVAVDDHRHFGRAAEACHVSQPTLSTQLKKLEQELGVALVERSPRHILLTDAGRLVVARARRILAEADDIRLIARHATDPAAGAVRLGIFPTLAPYLLPHVVPQIHAAFPKLELLLVEEKTEVLLEQLRSGRLDAAILALPVTELSLHEEPLFSEDFVLAVPADHPLAGSPEPVAPSVLATEDILLLEEGHCLRDQALAVCHQSGASERRGFRATSLETLRQMVAAGVGTTLLPMLAVQPPVPANDAMALVPLREPVPTRELAMFWRTTHVAHDLLMEITAIVRQVPPELLRSVPASTRS